MESEAQNPLKIASLTELIDNYSTFFFDLTGVVWTEGKEGQAPVPQTIEALNILLSLKKTVYFVSNNSVVSRAALCKKIQGFGVPDVKEKMVFTSGYLAARYIANLPNIKTVYAVGMDGLYGELDSFGLKFIKGESHNGKAGETMNQKAFREMEVCPEVNCVCVGIDLNFNYYKLCYASVCIDRQDASFVACDDDGYIMVADRKMPICGPIVQAISKATDKKAVICGKPNPLLLEEICRENKLEKSTCVMVGDSLESDVKMARDAGIDSVLMMGGVTSKVDLEKIILEGRRDRWPNYYI